MVKQIKPLILAPMLLAFAGNSSASDSSLPQALLKNDKISAAALSPSGDYIAYVAPVGDTDVLVVSTAKDLKPVYTTQMGSKRYVGQISWANDERFLLWPAKAYGKDQVKYFTGEVQAMNYDGSDNIKLWGYAKNKHDVRRGTFVMENRLKDDPQYIVAATTDSKYMDSGTRTLRKINIYNARTKAVERSSLPNADFVVDDSGKAVMQWGADEDANVLVSFKNRDDKWQPLQNAGQYQAGWAIDDQQLLLKSKENDKYVKFNRITMELTELDSDQVKIYEQTVENPYTAAINRSGEEPSGYFALTHIREFRQPTGSRISQQKIAQADKVVRQSNN